MNKNTVFAGLILILFILIMSGCLEYFNFDDGSITYTAHPTEVRYTISYGYRINCSGTGKYEIKYDCDKPEALVGTVSSPQLLYLDDYENITVANNNMISWTISGTDDNDYELGVSATVMVESFLVADLNGANTLSIEEINTTCPVLVGQYCQPQSNGTITFIDPNDPDIKENATSILNNADTNNAFIVAKELFIWLKQYTTYQIHIGNNNVQPACVTLHKKTGDCDDLSYLYISLCRAVGIPARFIRGYIVERDDDGASSAVSHAWAEVFVGGNISNNGWIPVECASTAKNWELLVNQNFGVEDASHLRLFVDDGSNESINTSLSAISLIRHSSTIDINADSFAEIDGYMVVESKKLVVDKDSYRTYN